MRRCRLIHPEPPDVHPPAFREDRIEDLRELIRLHPLGLLTISCASGLVATPAPFLVYAGEGRNGTLRAHMARANPHWRELRGSAECIGGWGWGGMQRDGVY